MQDTTTGITLQIGILTLDSTNEMYAGRYAAKTGDIVIAAPKLDTLLKAGVDAIVYDYDSLRFFGKPIDLVVPGVARLQVAFSYNFTRAEVRRLRNRGVIPSRGLKPAVRRVARLLRAHPAKAA